MNEVKQIIFLECGKRLKECREKNDKTLEVVGDVVGVHKSTISRWERGETEKISLPTIKALAEFFKVNPTWLMGYDVPMRDLSPIKYGDFVKIRVVGRVSAGDPELANEETLGYEAVPSDIIDNPDNYVGLKIKGRSMLPVYEENDVVIVRKQSDCESGQIAVVMVNGEDATVKKVIKNDNSITLVPLNNAEFDPRTFTREEIISKPVTIIGIVKKLIKNF